MAEAKKIEETVVKGITLNLSMKEAQALMAVIGNVSGNRYEAPRKHTDDVWLTLKRAGVENVFQNRVEGKISFRRSDYVF
ncbi:hypothetical protein ACFY5K_25825 [Streptomyces griseofuscus]|uniref:hypothetical protein n=1 Tax=Streptomyces griseofuscus TaxID=146922 RepID=UPI0036B82DB4